MEIPLLSVGKPSLPSGAEPSQIDSFLDRPSRLCGLYILAAYGFGGILLGLTIHSFPMFRPVACAVAVVVAAVLVGITGYPALQQHLTATKRYGVGPIYPGSKGKPKWVDGSVLLRAFTPVAALLLLMFVGIVIGML